MKSFNRVLRRKERMAYLYLIIAIVWAVFLLAANPLTEFYPSLIAWCAVIIYLAHFYYGAIFYPHKYRNEIQVYRIYNEQMSLGHTTPPAGHDWSFLRGYLASFLAAGILISVYELWEFALAWLALNALLSYASMTSSLFSDLQRKKLA